MLSFMHTRHGRSAQGVALSLLLVCGSGCASQGAHGPLHRLATLAHHRLAVDGLVRSRSTDASQTSLNGLYDAAIVSSAIFRAENQHSLVPVTGPTAMGSVISCDCPQGNCSSKCSIKAGSQVAPSDIWLSRGDQFLQFCQSFSPSLTAAEVILKLQELLGLPPQTNAGGPCTWQILQVEVAGLQVPSQFFRPCTNPDPTTPGPCGADFWKPVPGATVEFQAWMAGQAFSSWQIPSGYPWTHLGYTYNWDPQASSIVGVSEYVVPEGTPIQVTGMVPAVPLCTQNRLTCP